MIAFLHHNSEVKIGSTLTQIKLSIRLGRASQWVRDQGTTVCGLGETWRANFYNGGRIQCYELMAVVPVAARRA